MDSLDTHERIIRSEYYWYGGVLDVSKVFDADTRHAIDRPRKGRQQHPPSSTGDEVGHTLVLDYSRRSVTFADQAASVSS